MTATDYLYPHRLTNAYFTNIMDCFSNYLPAFDVSRDNCLMNVFCDVIVSSKMGELEIVRGVEDYTQAQRLFYFFHRVLYIGNRLSKNILPVYGNGKDFVGIRIHKYMLMDFIIYVMEKHPNVMDIWRLYYEHLFCLDANLVKAFGNVMHFFSVFAGIATEKDMIQTCHRIFNIGYKLSFKDMGALFYEVKHNQIYNQIL